MPINIILDGKLVEENLGGANLSVEDIKKRLAEDDADIDDVFYANINAKGEYYIQKSGLFQEGVIPSSDAFYYYIHFHGKYVDSKNAVPISGHSYFRKNYEGFEG